MLPPHLRSTLSLNCALKFSDRVDNLFSSSLLTVVRHMAEQVFLWVRVPSSSSSSSSSSIVVVDSGETYGGTDGGTGGLLVGEPRVPYLPSLLLPLTMAKGMPILRQRAGTHRTSSIGSTS